jgi:hypothetical protein
MGASLKSNYPQNVTRPTFFDVEHLSDRLTSFVKSPAYRQRSNQSLVIHLITGNAHRTVTGCLLTGFFCNQKSPAEIKWLLISLDTSERNECNRVRRSRARNEVFTDGEICGYVTWRYVLATRIRRAGGRVK